MSALFRFQGKCRLSSCLSPPLKIKVASPFPNLTTGPVFGGQVKGPLPFHQEMAPVDLPLPFLGRNLSEQGKTVLLEVFIERKGDVKS